MPVYEYLCELCGDFTAMRPISERDARQCCPECEAVATRIIRSAPASFLGDSTVRRAHARNERAAHEPGRRPAPRQDGGGKPQYKHADCGRPWMIGH